MYDSKIIQNVYLMLLTIHTFHTLISQFHICLQILRTRPILGQIRVRDSNLASSAPGALQVDQLRDVSHASKMAVVELDAAANSHSSVSRMSDENDLR